MSAHDSDLHAAGPLDRKSRNLYRKTREQLRDQGTWKDSDAPLLARYVWALQRAREARDELAGADSLTVVGNRGQVTAHPLVKVQREAEQDADARARELLLSPAARERAGIAHKPAEKGRLGL